MKHHRWDRGRFPDEEVDPLRSAATLFDVFLVFCCGLMAALVMASGGSARFLKPPEEVKEGREIPELPESVRGAAGAGLQPLGQVFRDPATGKLYMVEE